MPIPESKSDFAMRLIKHRKMSGYTQNDVAEKIGKSRSTYAYYERNVIPPIDVIQELSELFGVSEHELIRGDSGTIYTFDKNRRPTTITLERGPATFNGVPINLKSENKLSKKEIELLAYFNELTEELQNSLINQIKGYTNK